jgi:hypothetical protein
MTAPTSVGERSGSRPLSYHTLQSRYRVVVTTPGTAPELWAAYLAEAERSYDAHGVAGVLDLDRVRDGRSTSLFFAAFAPDGRLVGGMRSQGPYTSPDEAHAVAEWDRDPAQPLVRAMVEDRLPFGVVESKTAWVARELPGRRELVTCLARAPLHASMILGARFALGTSAVHTLPMWTATGAVAASGLSSVGYPDARYRTTVVWWDRWALPETVTEGEKRSLDLETAQMLSATIPAPRR